MRIASSWRLVSCAFIGMIVPNFPAAAADCSEWSQFRSSNPKLAPQSVSIGDIQNYMNTIETSEGVIFDIEQRQAEIWIDIVFVPDDATMVSGLRAVMQMGRILAGDFDRIVLSDEGTGVYQLPEAKFREIGCQFVWGEEGGQNPIYLIRLFFQNLEIHPTGTKAVSGFTGHLLGDTTRAMDYHNQQFARSWILSGLQ